MILVIDNYDSFVFNLVRTLEELGEETRVLRNDAMSVGEIAALGSDAVLLSPGPCTPREAGVCLPLIRALSGTVPMLGVCLGHQCLGAAFGGVVERAGTPLHGQATPVAHDGRALFEGLPQGFAVGRYHSLIVRPTDAMNRALTVDARSPEGEIMALSHRSHPSFGVQFHPESVLTEHGHALLANFLRIARRWHR